MLPVGILKASITKALNTKARINAVISHSKVSAISAARSFFFRTLLSGIGIDSFLTEGMHTLPARRLALYHSINGQTTFFPRSLPEKASYRLNRPEYRAQISRANTEMGIMPKNPGTVNRLFSANRPKTDARVKVDACVKSPGYKPRP